MARRRSEERASYWRGVIRDQATSGLSIQAFCFDREVSPASFYQWRRRLDETKRREVGAASNPPQPASSQFVAIDLPASLSRTASCCEVVLADGRRVLVPEQFDGDSLTALFVALRATSC